METTRTAKMTQDQMRSEITRLLNESRDLRYFDASDDNLTSSSSAGEKVRKHAARRIRAERNDVDFAAAVEFGIRISLPNQDLTALTATIHALRLCPLKG
jgi:hypothetical protein